ncbi:hypothetical protein ACFLRW_03150 [Acidobacteriota bacterium]
MKIDQTEIKNIIGNPFLQKTSKTKRNCPSPRKLIALLRFEIPERKRSKIIDHTADCRTCAQEIKFMNEILKAEENFEKTASQIVIKEKPASRKKGLSDNPPFPKLTWSSISVVAVLTTIILSTSMFFLLKTIKPAIERDTILQLNHISPNEKSLSLSELVFQWENIPDSDYYTMEIFDDSLKLVWRSERIIENKVIPSTELKELLKPDIIYKWMVTSFLKNGKLVESDLASFNLK